jgi:hypothetical protein
LIGASYPTPVVAIIPFKNRISTEYSLYHLNRTVCTLSNLGYCVVLVEDGPTGITRWPERLSTVISLPENRGKIYAARIGIQFALEMRSSKYYAICDWDDEQDHTSIPNLVSNLSNSSNCAIIGNRYGFFLPRDLPPHRIAANFTQTLLSRSLGSRCADLVSGISTCDRGFAEFFVANSKAEREGVGFDWLPLSALGGMTLFSKAIGASMRSNTTDRLKLIRNFKIPLKYEADLSRHGYDSAVRFCSEICRRLTEATAEVEIPVDILGSRHRVIATLMGDSCSFLMI